MALYTNYYDYPVRLHVRLPNKEYFRQKVNNVELDSPTFTTYPFSSIDILPGATFDIGDAEIYEEVNFLLDCRSPYADGLTYTNDSDELKIVFYRLNNKLYEQPMIDGDTDYNSSESTSYKHDMVHVPPKNTVHLGDSTIIGVGVLGVDDVNSKFGKEKDGVMIPFVH